MRRRVLAVLLVGGALRLLWPELRPPHHDEASNWIHLGRVARSGVYRFDPTNFHGPSFFFLSAPARWAPDAWRLFAMRLPTMLVGLAMLPLTLRLRPLLGRATLPAAAMLALSPTAVYFARDAIHETTLAFATLAALVAATRRAPWALGAALGLMIATKETVVLTFGAWAVAAAVAAALGARPKLPPWRPVLAGAAGVVALLYSSFGRRLGDLLELARALTTWTRRGLDGGGHAKPPETFALWLAEAETGPLLLATVGAAAGLRRRDPVDAALLAWTATLLVAYSAIPYKTPWCLLQITLPLALLAGRGLLRLWDARRAGRIAAAALTVLTLAQAVDASFVRYDDKEHPLVYVQTHREVLDLVDDLQAAHAAGADGDLGWYLDTTLPFGFLLRRSVGRDDRWPEAVDAEVVVTRKRDELLLHRRTSRPYARRRYRFRDGERVDAWFAADLLPHLPPRSTDLVPPTPEAFDAPPVPAATAPGWRVSYTAGKVPGRAPHHVEARAEPSLRFADDHGKPQWAPHVLTWDGWFTAAAPGPHRIEVDSDDGADVWVAGRRVIAQDGTQGPRTQTAAVQLPSGPMHVRVAWADFGGPARFDLRLGEGDAEPGPWPAGRTVRDASLTVDPAPASFGPTEEVP